MNFFPNCALLFCSATRAPRASSTLPPSRARAWRRWAPPSAGCSHQPTRRPAVRPLKKPVLLRMSKHPLPSLTRAPLSAACLQMFWPRAPRRASASGACPSTRRPNIGAYLSPQLARVVVPNVPPHLSPSSQGADVVAAGGHEKHRHGQRGGDHSRAVPAKGAAARTVPSLFFLFFFLPIFSTSSQRPPAGRIWTSRAPCGTTRRAPPGSQPPRSQSG